MSATEPNSPERGTVERVLEEVDRSRAAHPEPGVHRYAAFASEAGEVFQAYEKHLTQPTDQTIQALAREIDQAAAMAVRFLVEGDETVPGLPEAANSTRLRPIGECVPAWLMGERSPGMQRKLDAYRAIGAPEDIVRKLTHRQELLSFVREALWVMETNSRFVDSEMRQRLQAEEAQAAVQRSIEAIVTALADHPEVETGNSKVHYAYQLAKGAQERIQAQGDIAESRLRRERDEALAAAGWLAHVVLDDKRGSGTADQWIRQGARFYRDALIRGKRHQHICAAAKERLEALLERVGACPDCGETGGKHEEKCPTGLVLTALEVAATERKD